MQLNTYYDIEVLIPNCQIGTYMRQKSKKATEFIQSLHLHLVKSPLLRKNVQNKTEQQIQTELRPIMFEYMKKHFV